MDLALVASCHFNGGVKTISRQSLSIVTSLCRLSRGSVYVYLTF